MSSFPASPTNGATFTNALGVTWTYDSTRTAWTITGQTYIGSSGYSGTVPFTYGATSPPDPTGMADGNVYFQYGGTGGLSGYSGVSGQSGAVPGGSGYSGISGYSGYSGVSGYSGKSGYSGQSGYSGVSGYSGISGVSGYSGVVSSSLVVTTLAFASEVSNTANTGSTTINWNSGNKQVVTLSSNTTFTFTAPTGGECNLVLRCVQDGTGGRVATWPAAVLAPGGKTLNLVLSTGINRVDIVSLYYNGTNYYATITKNFVA